MLLLVFLHSQQAFRNCRKLKPWKLKMTHWSQQGSFSNSFESMHEQQPTDKLGLYASQPQGTLQVFSDPKLPNKEDVFCKKVSGFLKNLTT